MDQNTAIKTFSEWARAGRVVFTLGDLAKLFHGDQRKTLLEALRRLVHDGVLQRAGRGVYDYVLTGDVEPRLVEQIAVTLRRGYYSYTSLESALSEYGAISQIPVDRLTVMTTGRKGVYRTQWGTIEFTHTKRSPADILDNTRDVGRPLRMATQQAAWRDLKRVGRNTHLVDERALSND
jgi:hypothetical protein